MKENLSILKKCILFNNIEENNIIPLLGCINGKVKKYQKGDVIYNEGDNITLISIVLTGKVQMNRYDYNGNRSIVAIIEKSHLFGEAFACSGINKIPVEVEATEESEILFVDTSKILKPCCNACGFHTQMIQNLLRAVSLKNIILNNKIEVTSKRTTREKLLTFLYLKSKEYGSNSFYIPYDRQSLADYLEVERSGLSMEISKLIKEGIIESNKNYFKII